MGILNIFKSDTAARLSRLPEGSFTLDPEGRILTSTVPQWFPPAQVQDIGQRILATFQGAQEAQLQLGELVVHYGALKITARALRGGAIVFLAPKTIESALPKP